VSRVLVDRREYDALCDLRDGAHDRLLVKYERLEYQLEHQRLLEKQTKKLINEQSLTIDHLRKESLARHELILKMQSRLQQLEPVKIDTPQPMFARKR
jgi:hypothetical protein